MPRLTHSEYDEHRLFLQDAWQDHQAVFPDFSSEEQWILHRYFAPSKDLSDTELRQHRRAVTVAHPSLPHRAGKLMLRFHELYHAHLERQAVLRKRTVVPAWTQPRRPGQQRITVKSVVQPEIDMDKLARVIHLYAQQTAAAAGDNTPTSQAT